MSDSNPNALDAGLDALTAFLQKADEEYAARCALRRLKKPNAPVSHASACRGSFAGALANNLVSKGLTARPKTVTRASDALLLLIELDAADATLVSSRALSHVALAACASHVRSHAR